MTDITITSGSHKVSGWQDIRLTRGIERCPSDFDIAVTEKFNDAVDIVFRPGDAITVQIDSNLVLTGYIDVYQPDLSADHHDVRINGRSKCEDLVDCSAGFNTDGTWKGSFTAPQTVQQLATSLCQPFGITVSNNSGDPGPILPSFYVNFGESVFEVIERCARYAGFLVYDDVDGNLVLARVGNQQMASGFVEGTNCQVESAQFTMNGRFSDYFVAWQTVDSQSDTSPNSYIHGHAQDQGVPRFRPLGIVSEQILVGQDLGQRRADWERNRRYGRSQAIRIVADSWYDTANTLWTPNSYATVNCPTVKVADQRWIISEVTYHLGLQGGTTAEVVLMPKEAFEIEPVVLNPYGPDITQGLDNNKTNNPELPEVIQT